VRKVHHTHAWRIVRRAILERDGHVCQIRGQRCTGVATHVDHIVPAADGGAWLDPTNLRAACQTCNLERRVSTQTRRGQPSRDW
jgi:5-methylcytosine-specific restriction protein A